MSDDDLITVCESCLRASCWQGNFFCENFYDSDVIQKTRGELRELALENESYWITDDELVHPRPRVYIWYVISDLYCYLSLLMFPQAYE